MKLQSLPVITITSKKGIQRGTVMAFVSRNYDTLSNDS